MHQIIIRVARDGKTSVKAEGYQGPDCSVKTAPFIEALGRRIEEVPTEEMFQATQQLEIRQ